MKTVLLSLLSVVVLSVFSGLRAEEVVTAVAEAPDWLQRILEFAVGIPYVGPVLMTVLKWMGLIAALLTALSAFLVGVSLALQKVTSKLGFKTFADQVQKWTDKILPIVKYLSMFNVQKKELPKG